MQIHGYPTWDCGRTRLDSGYGKMEAVEALDRSAKDIIRLFNSVRVRLQCQGKEHRFIVSSAVLQYPYSLSGSPLSARYALALLRRFIGFIFTNCSFLAFRCIWRESEGSISTQLLLSLGPSLPFAMLSYTSLSLPAVSGLAVFTCLSTLPSVFINHVLYKHLPVSLAWRCKR